MELLSPAGSMETLRAALYNGADAVYIGPKFFNARRLAGNFNDIELQIAINLAHLHGVKIYLTLNTLVRNEELDRWFKTLAVAYSFGIDAVIIQEVSFLPIIKKHFPGLKVHASTQASFMNYHGINEFPDFDLVVLARELKGDEISVIRKKIKQKLEVFVHGHLCISYSGQCLISSLIGQRSGNRGVCASSCRKEYNHKGYLISPRDLMMANQIDELLALGIDSIKIEGRMKSPEYVAITARTYRKQIDDAVAGRMKNLSSQEINNLRMGFNRDFTPGFFKLNTIIDPEMPMNRGILLGSVVNGKLRLEYDLELYDGVGFWNKQGKLEGGIVREMFANNKPMKKARIGDLVSLSMRHFRNGVKVFLTSQNKGGDVENKKMVDIPLTLSGKVGSPLRADTKAGVVESDIPLQFAQKHALDKSMLETEFKKSTQMDINWKISSSVNNCFLPKSTLTKLRRDLEEKVCSSLRPVRSAPTILLQHKVKECKEDQLLVKIYSIDQLKEALLCNVDVIYFDVFHPDLEEARKLCTTKFFVDTPVVLTDRDILKIKTIIQQINPDGALISNWGLLDLPIEKHGKYSLNTFNDLDMEHLQEHGVLPMFSVELSYKNLEMFKNREGIYYAHGRLPVMHFKGVLQERSLTDDKNYTFPIREVHGNTEMLFSRPIATFEHILKLKKLGIRYFMLDLERDTTTIIHAYQSILSGVKKDISMLKKGTTIKNFSKGVV